MELRNLLLDRARPMEDPALSEFRSMIFKGDHALPDIVSKDFINRMERWLLSNPEHELTGLNCFPIRHACFGVTHYIDSLLVEHSNNVQMLDHDYMYYRRLFPDKEWSSVGKLIPNVPLIMALPFPGAGDIHPQMGDILEECLNKNISVNLDCAWLPIARKMQFNFSHPAIDSIAFSLSKGLSLGWNRIGIRYSMCESDQDPISIANSFDMINRVDMKIGYEYMERFDNGYLWQKYGDAYDHACRTLRLRPTNVLHMAFELGTNKPRGMRDVLLELEQQGF